MAVQIQKTCHICIHARTCEERKEAVKRELCERWELDAKAWLSRGKHIMGEIAALEESKRQAFERATSRQKPAQKKISRGKPSRGDAVLVSYADYSRLIDARITELNKTLAEIAEAIYSVGDGLLRMVLINRYVLFKSWEVIAVDLNYAWKYIHRLHAKSLGEIKTHLERGKASEEKGENH